MKVPPLETFPKFADLSPELRQIVFSEALCQAERDAGFIEICVAYADEEDVENEDSVPTIQLEYMPQGDVSGLLSANSEARATVLRTARDRLPVGIHGAGGVLHYNAQDRNIGSLWVQDIHPFRHKMLAPLSDLPLQNVIVAVEYFVPDWCDALIELLGMCKQLRRVMAYVRKGSPWIFPLVLYSLRIFRRIYRDQLGVERSELPILRL